MHAMHMQTYICFLEDILKSQDKGRQNSVLGGESLHIVCINVILYPILSTIIIIGANYQS